MNFSKTDYQYMARAFALAQRGRYTVSPNPMVGAVVVRDGKIIGEGWHQRAGEAHAEINALTAAGDAAGAEMFVTLEPCNHQGRTGPCAQALLDAGIARVVIGTADDNPLAAGGAQRLRAAGVDVAFMAGWPDINSGFTARVTTGLPAVTLKLAASVDGRTAMASGESQWITGPAARHQVQKLRAGSCAIITGVGSVIVDDSRLTLRVDDWLEPYPDDNVRQPLRVVVDSNLSTNPKAAIVGPNTLIACVQSDAPKRSLLEAAGAVVIQLPANSSGCVDLEALLRHLATEYQCNNVMVEAGANLSGAFMQAGLVDELHLFTAAKLMGSDARALLQLPLVEMADAMPLSLDKTRAVGTDIWQTYTKTGD